MRPSVALVLRLLPMLLLSLLLGCVTDSSLFRPTSAPPIPPLMPQAKQHDLPKFSEDAQTDIQAWQQELTPLSSPAKPASSPTSP